MKIARQKLLIEQIDRKIKDLQPLANFATPTKGWIYTVRIALKMSYRQLGERLEMTPQGVRELEKRESNGAITVRILQEVAKVLEMKFAYGLIPKEESIEKMIENRANELAKEIVMRTSHSMMLEDQVNSEERINNAIKVRADEIKSKMPRYLWD